MDLTTQLSSFLKGLLSGYIQLTETTFAKLPSAPSAGAVAAISDSDSVTWGATVSGGGTDHALIYYDGTNWTVAGK